MRKKSTEQLTAAEWKIMKIMWELKSAPARDVCSIAGEEHGWAPTTVKTILSNLVDKGFLNAKEEGPRYIYSPAKPAMKTLTFAADDLIDKSVEPLQGRLLCYMANKIQLSDSDVNELQSILDRHKEKSDQ